MRADVVDGVVHSRGYPVGNLLMASCADPDPVQPERGGRRRRGMHGLYDL